MAFLGSPDWPNVGRMLKNPHGVEDLVFQLEMLLFFYLNYFILIDAFYFPKKFIQYFIVLIALFILFVPVTGFVIHAIYPMEFPPDFMPPPPHKKRSLFMFLINRKLYIFSLTLAFSLFLRIWQRLKKIEKDKLGTELSMLKAQINPHFLFNTLNSIYSLSLQKSDLTSEAIVKLSTMMRYVLKDSEKKHVYLKEEMNYLNDYIELQKLRLNENVKLEFSVEGAFADAKIAPLMLIPFIENAFKYGLNTEESSEISIHILYHAPQLKMMVHNTKSTENFDSNYSTELGIHNAKRRLNLLYPSKHQVMIAEQEHEFEVKLIIDLND